MRGKFYESEYEEALIDLLQDEGWQYTNGGNIHRQLREPLLIEDPNVNDLHVYLQHRYPDLTSSDVNEVVNYLRHVPGQTHFERLRNTFQLVRDGYRYTRHGDGVNFDIRFIDFESPDCKKYNIFRAINQFEVAYGMKDDVRIPDVLLFVNGIPLCIFELKNPTKLDADIAQAYEQIHIRYMRDIPHLLRYCPLSCISDATDNNTRLGTTYTPYEHYYAWKKVNNEDPSAQKGIDQVRTIVKGVYEPSRFLEILRDYVYFPDEKSGKEEEIVCRYPQFFATRMMLDSIRRAFEEQTSKGGTYFGATGCGKTYTMMFIARQLALRCKELGSPTVIMIVDRDDLQTQAGKLFLRSQDFLQLGTVKVIADREELKTELSLRDSGGFFICTIQKFLFAKKDMEKFRGRKFAIIIDEAHQGQNGESAKSLRRSLIDLGVAIKEYAEEAGIEEEEVDLTDEYINAVIGQGRHDNQSFFAFTATPKGQTLESFGTVVGMTLEGEPIKAPFHVYSMRQAIEEGYILDVLANYTTVKEAFRLIRVSEDNPELIEGQASRALFKYYKQHGYTIAQKTEMIMTNFLENCRYQIGGKGKAMVVADSRANAVRYYLAIKKYLADHAEQCVGCDVMIAFSGEVTLDDYPSEKPFTEATMNLDENGKYITTDKKFRKAFHSSQYNILVVANKYQTGFDEPLLHTMYVDKKLRDVTAVQTLSRLNRTTFGKNSTFVLDFENTEEDIKGAFLPYYETTTLEGSTDLNRVYDLRNKIRDFMLYNFEDVEAFNKFMATQASKEQDATALGRLAGMFRPVIARYMDLSEEDRYTVRDYVRKFNKAYAFVTQLVRLHDRDLFNEYQYTLHLIRLLPRIGSEDIGNIEDKIKLEYASLTETFRGAIVLDEKPPAFVPGGSTAPKAPNKKKDTLQSIIDKVNERFSGNFTDADRVIIEGIYQMFMRDSEVKKFRKYAKDNSTEMFVRSLFPDKFRDIVTQCFLDNNDSFAKLFNDPDFYQKVQEAMAQELYKALRKE